MINRRRLLQFLAIAAFTPISCFPRAIASTSSRPLVGAIRWDAWYDPLDGKTAKFVEHDLAPQEYHYRMPFFGIETGPDSVRIDGDKQEVMDLEIAAASKAGLDYWAFCTYVEDDPLSNALRLYLSSKKRTEIGFCLISALQSANPMFTAQTDYQIRMMLEDGYTTVLNGRPLYYLLSIPDNQIVRDGGIESVSGWVNSIRKQLVAKGRGNPYIVLAEGDPTRAVELLTALGLDAVGLYASPLQPFGGAPYKMLAEVTQRNWDTLAKTNLAIVPNVMTGWDNRPRQGNPDFWKNIPDSVDRVNHYYQEAKPEEIALHLQRALDWLKEKPSRSPANTTLIYAWNECDEGFGALIPTYKANSPNGDDSRLRAISTVLNHR